MRKQTTDRTKKMLGVFMLVFFVTSIAIVSANTHTPLTKGDQELPSKGANLTVSHDSSSITNNDSNVTNIKKEIEDNINNTFKTFN